MNVARGRRRRNYTFKAGSDDLVAAVTEAAESLCVDVDEDMVERLDEAGTSAAQLLRERSRKRTGAYAKGWQPDVVVNQHGVTVVVHNKKKPGLAHLLEKGHAKAGGGRVAGDGIIAAVADEVGGHLVEGFR